ncbi:MAG: cytochrome c biogenesis protein [Lentisphaerae bacterium]|nr:cytochrome c biogenesis protein [Lentisphaerota bacterium]
MWGTESILTLVGIALYAAASTLAVAALLRASRRVENSSLLLAAAGAIPFLIVLLFHGMKAGHMRPLTRFEAFSVYSVFLTAAYLFSCVKRNRLRGLAAIVVPYITFVLILGLPVERSEVVLAPKVQNIWLRIHIVSAFIGYASFSLAGLLAVAYLIQDRNLKRRRFGGLTTRLPALETMDRLMSIQVGVAFLMLTVSIVLGVLLVRLTGGGGEWVTDPKVVATVLTWCVFAILVHMRAWANRHGRRVAFVIIMGVLCLLFTFVGVQVISDSVHDYLMVGAGKAP